MFGRRRKKQRATDEEPAAPPQEQAEAPADDEAVPREAGPGDADGREVTTTADASGPRKSGPWDSDEEHPRQPRIDFGSLRVPVAPDVGVSWESDRDRKRILAIRVLAAKSILRIQVFASPKSGGLWRDTLTELAAGVSKQGGMSREVEGTFGPELRAVLPLKDRTDDQGRQQGQPARFIGVDGPRWMLRATVHGRAAVDAAAAQRMDELVRGIVVVRGPEPMPPRELLPLRLSSQTQELLQRARERAAQQNDPEDGAPDAAPEDPAAGEPSDSAHGDSRE